MKHLIDTLLNGITMYRLVLYYLLVLVLAAVVLSFFGVLPYDPTMIAFSVTFITAMCVVSNAVFAKAFKAPTNVESLYISALILALIITPPKTMLDGSFLELAAWASVWAMASKYIVAIGRKHLFNPVAFAVALTALTINVSASWWVATMPMMPFVLIGGLLVTRKILRFDLVLSFLAIAIMSIAGTHLTDMAGLVSTLSRVLIDVPILFFAFVMLTEPLTTPPTRGLRIAYGALTGLLFAPWVYIGSVHSTPELALLVGNVFSYLISPKAKLFLTLKEKHLVSTDVVDFRFTSDRSFTFRPGQYLEWTLAHQGSDSRGNRRYFTISSSPTEREIGLGVKFYQKSSSYKKELLSLRLGDAIIASQLSGDFVLPRDAKRKLVFVAGGIGVTPFRSMIRYLLDTRERRSIVLLYANRTAEDIAYANIFDEAQQQLGIKTVYTLTDRASVPPDWKGYTGYIDEAMIRREIPDHRERYFYLSGPRSMVVAFEETLLQMGIPHGQIIIDFFPGFA